MKEPPDKIDGAKVIMYSPIDSRHQKTDACQHIVKGMIVEQLAGLAICQFEGSTEYYLYGCGPKWDTITDTLHESLEKALEQAEFEYSGIGKTWIKRQRPTSRCCASPLARLNAER